MKEIVIISGKGGTGKTSIVSSFASLASSMVLADCDVDAADLHLIMQPKVRSEEDFPGGQVAVINPDICTECGECRELCRFDAIDENFRVNEIDCEGCTVCEWFCPVSAIEMKRKIAGKNYISDTRYGPMAHAKLKAGEDNSGKLVSKVREDAKKIAEEKNLDLILVDGSPGIGCPVIASITGASLVFIVCEPTVSGLHDLKRVVELINHFRMKCVVMVNKYDLNEEMTERIKNFCESESIEFAGKLPYDTDFTKAQIEGKSLVEYASSKTVKMLKDVWEKLCNKLND